MSRRLLSIVATFGLLSSAPRLSGADDVDALIKRGIDLRRQGKDSEALDVFQHANTVKSSPRSLAQIGLAEQALGRWLDAETHLEMAMATPADPWIARNRQTLDTSLASIGQHLGSLEVFGVAGAKLRVDDAVAGTLPLSKPLRVNTGSVVLELSAPNYLPVTRTVNIVSGQLTRETINLSHAPVMTPPVASNTDASSSLEPKHGQPIISAVDEQASPAGAARRSPARTAAWVTLWTATALAAGGAGAFIIRQVDAVDFNDNCVHSAIPLNMAQQTQCHDWQTGGQTWRNIGIATLIGAGALGLTSGILFYISRPTLEGQVAFACLPAFNQAGLTCAARF